MTKTTPPVAVLKAGEERRIQRGYLWIYRNDLDAVPDLVDGDVFDVFSANRRFVCRAFYQAEGGIAGRVLSFHQRDIDPSYLKMRLEHALSLRRRLFPGAEVYRWIHGESDLLPGVVVDRYGAVAVIQSTCAFYALCLDVFAEAVLRFDGVKTVVYQGRQGAETRGEALQEQELQIGDVRVAFTPESSQKTGLFLDQRENWPLAAHFAKESVVLDGYCYHGLWSIHAALGGAARVVAVDTSEPALARARINAELNGVGHACEFRRERVENLLDGGETFDMIVLDPPAFAKTRRQARKAMGLYEDINMRAMKALNPDGLLVTCSCSHFVPRNDFLEVIKRAARRTARQVQVLKVCGAAPDHPVLPMMPETEYLKCVLLRVL